MAVRGVKVKGGLPPSLQFGDGVGPVLDGGLDGVVLVGRDPDGLPGEGDVGVAMLHQERSRRRAKGFDTPDGLSIPPFCFADLVTLVLES